MADNFLSPPRSRWGFATPSKRLIEYQVKEGQKQQLLQQASSLVPDYSKLSEALMANEMHSADQMRMKNLLDGVTSQYMENYNRNPFYSFSRDARNMARTMHSIINDPRIKQLTQQYEYDRARWEEGRKDGLVTNFDVNENGILVGTPVKDDSGAVVDFRINRKRNIERGDVPLTLNDTYQYITRTAGGGYGGFNYNMSTDQQLLNNLDKAFQNLGETKIKQDIIEQGRSVMTSNNRVQINNRVSWLLNQGVSNADMNNLYSKYFKETGDFNMDNAKKYAVKYIADYAEGMNEAVMESEYFAEVRKRAAGGGGDDSGSTRQLPIPYVTAFLDGGPKQLSQITTSRGNTVIGEGNVISGILEGATDRRIKSLPVLSQLSTAGGFIVNLNDDKERGLRNGDFVNPPNISFEDMVVSDRVDKAPKMLVLPVDNNGRPANVDDAAQIGALLQQEGQAIPNQFRKYFRFATPEDVKNGVAKQPGDPIVNQKYFTQVTVNVPERRFGAFGGTKPKDAETDEAFRSYGHLPFDDTRLRESYSAGSGGAELNAPWIGFNDRVYEVDLFIPTDNTEPFMQDKVRGTTDALLLGDSSRLRDPSRPVSRAHLGLEPFNMVRNRTKYPTFPGK